MCGRLPRSSVAAHGRCVNPEQYDAWYRTPRGAWIGDIEFRMLVGMLRAQPGDGLLDVGCGTGYFSRRFAREAGLQVSGVDPDPAWLAYARTASATWRAVCRGTRRAAAVQRPQFRRRGERYCPVLHRRTKARAAGDAARYAAARSARPAQSQQPASPASWTSRWCWRISRCALAHASRNTEAVRRAPHRKSRTSERDLPAGRRAGCATG